MSTGPQQTPNRSGGRKPGVSATTKGRSPRQTGRRAQGRNPFPIVLAVISAIAILATAITIYLLAQPANQSAATLGTPTPAPTIPVPTAVTPLPTVNVGAVPTPDAAAISASNAACSPFLKAAKQPQGSKKWGAAPAQVINSTKHYQVSLYTTYGLITADILPKLAPITANNFVFLACQGYFNGITFHRIVPSFVIQGGDPLGTGTGGPGYSFKDEPVARTYEIGDLAMANSGPDTNGSQFFVIQGKDGAALPHKYNLFGHVTAGENVVDLIANAPSHALSTGGEKSTPDHPVHMTRVLVSVSG